MNSLNKNPPDAVSSKVIILGMRLETLILAGIRSEAIVDRPLRSLIRPVARPKKSFEGSSLAHLRPAAAEEGRMVSDPSDQEDLEKVKEFLSGKESAFEFLFDKYREKVFAVAFRFVRDKEDALEIVQDVFLRIYQGLAKFKTDSKFFTWLYRITVNRAIDLLRSRKSRPAVAMAAREEEENFETNIADPQSSDPAALFDQKETGRQVLSAVAQLSEKHRTVFLLHAVEELSYKEIAEVLGCSIGTVMSRLFYARKKLQELLAGLDCL